MNLLKRFLKVFRMNEKVETPELENQQALVDIGKFE